MSGRVSKRGRRTSGGASGHGRISNGAGAAGGNRRTRRVYEVEFKLEVVAMALGLPEGGRIKPTCRAYPGVEPVSRSTRPKRAPKCTTAP